MTRQYACSVVNYVVRRIAYQGLTQQILAPSSFFRDTNNYNSYLSTAVLLPELNNEKPHSRFSENRRRFTSLNSFMMVWFTGDNVVAPNQSEKFGERASNGEIIDMTETRIYKSDLFGLKTMDEAGKLKVVELPGDHLNFHSKEVAEIFVPFL